MDSPSRGRVWFCCRQRHRETLQTVFFAHAASATARPRRPPASAWPSSCLIHPHSGQIDRVAEPHGTGNSALNQTKSRLKAS